MLRVAAMGAAAWVHGARRGRVIPSAAAGTGTPRRYLGYRGDDARVPWAPYLAERTLPVPDEVARAYAGPPLPAAQVPVGGPPAARPTRGGALGRLVAEIDGTGSDGVETGYGIGADGTAWVAVRTEMPGVTAGMWDWWFGWHLSDTTRYKLWHPDAHAFTALPGGGPPIAPGTRRDRYVGRTSYVDEFVGPYLQQLAIRFHDPVEAGFTVGPGVTVILGRVGSAVLPLDLGWVCHQVRQVPGGAEMRSRFHLNVLGPRLPHAGQMLGALTRNPFPPLSTPLPLDARFARELLHHCGAEMNHLASFLPGLHAEFRDVP